MNVTRQTLLQEAADGSEQAWTELVEIYEPLIHGWLNRNGVNRGDCDEIVQEVMIVLHRKLGEFSHSGNVGAFRKWLRTITINQFRSNAGKNSNKPHGVGGSVFHDQIQHLDDEHNELVDQWNREHDKAVVEGLLKQIGKQLDRNTLDIFRRLTFDEVDAADVAKEFSVSVGSVYSCKSRVLRKIRLIGKDLLDSSYFEGRSPSEGTFDE